MLSKKLITLLQTFSKHDLQQFSKYVRSPFFNEQEELIELYELIEIELKSGNFELEKKDAWEKLYGKVTYKDIQMRRMTSEMTRLAEGYLVQKELKKQAVIERPLIQKALNKPSLNKHFSYAFRQIIASQERLGIKNLDYYYESFLIAEEARLFHERLSSSEEVEYLIKASYYIDCYYYAVKLRYYCVQMNYSMVRRVDYETKKLHILLEEISQKHLNEEPIIQVYSAIAKLFSKDKTDEYYENALEIIESRNVFFSSLEIQNIYLFLQNFCAVQINNGHVQYYRKMFTIYQLLDEQKILAGEKLNPGIYKNIITIGLSIGEYDWVEQFIKNYTQKLPKDNQENALVYNLSQVYFSQKKYDLVIEQLREVEYKNVVYALGGKLTLLKTYFEMREQRALDSLSDSFRIYLRRNRLISKDVRQQYMNSLRFTKKLANLAPYDKKGLQKVREQIEKCKALAAKKWLLEKVAEME